MERKKWKIFKLTNIPLHSISIDQPLPSQSSCHWRFLEAAGSHFEMIYKENLEEILIFLIIVSFRIFPYFVFYAVKACPWFDENPWKKREKIDCGFFLSSTWTNIRLAYISSPLIDEPSLNFDNSPLIEFTQIHEINTFSRVLISSFESYHKIVTFSTSSYDKTCNTTLRNFSVTPIPSKPRPPSSLCATLVFNSFPKSQTGLRMIPGA